MSFAAAILRSTRAGVARNSVFAWSTVLEMGPQMRPMSIAAATAAGASAAGAGAVFRVMGHNIPWPAIVGVSLASVILAFGYESKKIADVDRVPLEAELQRKPQLPEGAMLTSQTGKKVDVVAKIRGKHALLAFGALHSTDQPVLETMAKAAESAKQKTGFACVPVYISLDPTHDKPEDLKMAAGRSGSPSMLVVTGPPDGLLGAAEKFKNMVNAKQQAAVRSTETAKKVGEATMARGYVSDNLYVIDQVGRIVAAMPKNMRAEKIANRLAEEVQRNAVMGVA